MSWMKTWTIEDALVVSGVGVLLVIMLGFVVITLQQASQFHDYKQARDAAQECVSPTGHKKVPCPEYPIDD